MTLLPLNDEADCLAHQHENRVGFLSITTTTGRSPLPRERFRSATRSGHRSWLPLNDCSRIRKRPVR